MIQYQEEEFLQISGIQHFVFCRRQWALIDVEQQWAENSRTVEGELLHEKAHEEGFREKRGGLLTVRGLRVFSSTLGVSGACDVVEFRQDPNGVPLREYPGLWLAYPVEYKRGEPKEHDADKLQLCCQAMCLEEMLATQIPEGALFYGEPRRREVVAFTPEMREQVKAILREMHALHKRGYTPKVKTGKFCRACSLFETCLPKLCKDLSAKAYIQEALDKEASP